MQPRAHSSSSGRSALALWFFHSDRHTWKMVSGFSARECVSDEEGTTINNDGHRYLASEVRGNCPTFDDSQL
jgi:hypothetical protein